MENNHLVSMEEIEYDENDNNNENENIPHMGNNGVQCAQQ